MAQFHHFILSKIKLKNATKYIIHSGSVIYIRNCETLAHRVRS